jgi:hypothetical protein
MLPANNDDRAVHVRRDLDVDEDVLNDALTDFAVDNHLEIDRTYEGDGLLFRAVGDAEQAMFRRGDTLVVIFEPSPSGLDVTLAADMAGLEARGEAWKRGRLIRGSIFAALFVGAGVSGLAHGVNTGDFVPIALGGLFMSRTIRRVRGEGESREELQRRVGNALHRVLDEAERNSD